MFWSSFTSYQSHSNELGWINNDYWLLMIRYFMIHDCSTFDLTLFKTTRNLFFLLNCNACVTWLPLIVLFIAIAHYYQNKIDCLKAVFSLTLNQYKQTWSWFFFLSELDIRLLLFNVNVLVSRKVWNFQDK